MLDEYGNDGFLPIMVFYDGTPETTAAFAQEKGLTFPVLSDPDRRVFDRWDPEGVTPSSTLLSRGVKVHDIDTSWHTAMLEELLAQ